nr:tyrosine-type recombinase/integrase [Methylobacterium radiotolerans]
MRRQLAAYGLPEWVHFRDCLEAGKTGRIANGVGSHTPRHSFAAHILKDGVVILVNQVLLAHSRLQPTALYAKVAIRMVRTQNKPFERLAQVQCFLRLS